MIKCGELSAIVARSVILEFECAEAAIPENRRFAKSFALSGPRSSANRVDLTLGEVEERTGHKDSTPFGFTRAMDKPISPEL